MPRVLVTGAAGFIGFHVAASMLQQGCQVLGIDNLSPYYSVKLKQDRLAILQEDKNFQFLELDISRTEEFLAAFRAFEPDYVVHLAAQAGVRASLDNPQQTVDANITGTLSVLEACRAYPVQHLVFASSSSVYGANDDPILRTTDRTDHPVSLYGATKKANEVMAYSYSHLFGIRITGLRFFSVYGPWGRPDMALWKFTEAIYQGKPIDVYNFGKMKRDFTFIGDVVYAVDAVLFGEFPLTRPVPPYSIYNIGNNKPVTLLEFIETIERISGRKAVLNYLPLQPGDVLETCADIEETTRDFQYAPFMSLSDGIFRFITWYCDYHGLSL